MGSELVHHHQDLGEGRLQAGLDTSGAVGQRVQRQRRLVHGGDGVGPAELHQQLVCPPFGLLDLSLQLVQSCSRERSLI